MKKIMCYVLVLCMLFGMSITVSADSLEEMQISELTKNYLTISSSARYERGDVDLICDTVSSLSQERVNSLKEKVAQKVRKDSAANSIGIDADIGRYFSEKALYFKYLREENDSYVTDFKTIYGKPEITIDGDTAEVKIFQTIGMQYPDLDEESAISTNYVISLVRTEYGWKISNISSDDLFDNTHNMDFKAEEEIQKRQKLQTQPASIVAETTCPSIEELRAAAAANGAKVYSYNRTNAAYYSKQYTTSTRDVYAATEYYNKNFPNFAGPGDGGDCMNFASQCMFAGFGGSDEPNIRAYDPPMDRVGNSYDGQWYFDPAGSRSGSWTGTMTFQDYVEKSKNKL
ncbi:amidase domain-containing protein [uncultured Neglectibacter sp.]|uniref:amidase domain-containing protein n=1 Tax=uncultured Neglectibacter sp. TaxID=1924108 RepID=UPI0034E03D46